MKPTLEELSQWTDEQLRVKCAELRGWRKISCGARQGMWRYSGSDKTVLLADNSLPPNFPADLNACAEFVGKVDSHLFWNAVRHLVIDEMQKKAPILHNFRPSEIDIYIGCMDAPAKMRAIAYIFTTWK